MSLVSSNEELGANVDVDQVVPLSRESQGKWLDCVVRSISYISQFMSNTDCGAATGTKLTNDGAATGKKRPFSLVNEQPFVNHLAECVDHIISSDPRTLKEQISNGNEDNVFPEPTERQQSAFIASVRQTNGLYTLRNGSSYNLNVKPLLTGRSLISMHIEVWVRALLGQPLRANGDLNVLQTAPCEYCIVGLGVESGLIDETDDLEFLRRLVEVFPSNWEIIRMPMYGNAHWVSFVINKRTGVFTIVDSLPETNHKKTRHSSVLKPLANRLKMLLPRDEPGWQVKVEMTGVQDGNSDCALYTAVYCSGLNPEDFERKEYRYMRVWMWWQMALHQYFCVEAERNTRIT